MRAHGSLSDIPPAGTSDHICRVDDAEDPAVDRAPGSGVPPFQVFLDEGRVVLAGTIDTFGADRLARVLTSSPVDGRVVVLDLGRADFVDVAGARTIARWARELGARSIELEVRGASALLRRMWHSLALDRLAPVRFAAAVA
ncbi:STAS domain-containing protein [Blastococcus tunisiensis]|uniref:STAS domain-containing protein n=1 Tax=Blastococcus tunisiensis TaxID=1798228 RepID=A0A1I2L6T1_9ACTN|nr:STAS domain-containing protein [Blastococcus sp. DSM 46838]SFF74258.1 STAS domain-containing protein [Blastococcus sp. DSM 46838]